MLRVVFVRDIGVCVYGDVVVVGVLIGNALGLASAPVIVLRPASGRARAVGLALVAAVAVDDKRWRRLGTLALRV